MSIINDTESKYNKRLTGEDLKRHLRSRPAELEYLKHKDTFCEDFNEQELDKWDAVANYLWMQVIEARKDI